MKQKKQQFANEFKFHAILWRYPIHAGCWNCEIKRYHISWLIKEMLNSHDFFNLPGYQDDIEC